METVAFTSFASESPRQYPDALGGALLSGCTAMLIYTWLVLVLEKVTPLGDEPPLLLLPPPPRLLMPRFAASKPPTIHVQPSRSNLPRAESISISDSGTGEGFPGRGGRQNVALVVPTEGLKGGGSGG